MNHSDNFPFQILSCARVSSDIHTPVIQRRNAVRCVVEYVIRGRGFLEIDGRSYHAETGSVYFLHKGSTHAYWPDPEAPWEKLFFVADGPLMEELLRVYRLSDVCYIPSAEDLLPFFETLLCFDAWSPCFHERAAVLFHQFAAACFEHLYHPDGQAKHSPEKIRNLKTALDRSLEHRFVLDSYCRRAGLSTAYAIRGFRLAFGVTPKEYLLRLRLDKAKQLLQYSALSVKEIASTLDFFDQYHFSRFFRARTGFAPSVYRNSRRRGESSEFGKKHLSELKTGGCETIIPRKSKNHSTTGGADPCSVFQVP